MGEDRGLMTMLFKSVCIANTTGRCLRSCCSEFYLWTSMPKLSLSYNGEFQVGLNNQYFPFNSNRSIFTTYSSDFQWSQRNSRFLMQPLGWPYTYKTWFLSISRILQLDKDLKEKNYGNSRQTAQQNKGSDGSPLLVLLNYFSMAYFYKGETSFPEILYVWKDANYNTEYKYYTAIKIF